MKLKKKKMSVVTKYPFLPPGQKLANFSVKHQRE